MWDTPAFSMSLMLPASHGCKTPICSIHTVTGLPCCCQHLGPTWSASSSTPLNTNNHPLEFCLKLPLCMCTPIAGCDAPHYILQRLFIHGCCHAEHFAPDVFYRHCCCERVGVTYLPRNLKQPKKNERSMNAHVLDSAA